MGILMADFSSYPALDIQQMASPLDMASKAAALNGQLLTNTGMGLAQHYTRLSAMARAGASLLNPDGTADPATVKNSITDMVKNGIITASEGATALTSIPNDPKMAGQKVRELLAGVGNNLDAITPHMEGFDTGAGTVYRNTKPFAAGGNQTPAQITKGISPESAKAYESWKSATGQTHVGTHEQFLADVGANGNPIIAPPGWTPDAAPAAGAAPAAAQPPVTKSGATPPVSTTQLPPTGQDMASATMAALGTTNKLTATAPAPSVNRMLPPAAAVPPVQPVAGQGAAPVAAPGAIGTPITIDSQQAIGQTANATNYQADVDAGSGPAMQTRIDNLHELAGTIDQAFTGGLQGQKAYAEKLMADIGSPFDSGASGSDILHKLSEQAASYLPGAGATDAARSQAMGMTPNGDMTKDAIKTTTAMVLGKAQYDQQYSKDLVAWKAAGGDATNDYASFKTQYADTHPGPMLYAAMAMRELATPRVLPG